MEKRERVRQVVLQAMRSKLVMFSEESIAEDAADRIMEIFEPKTAVEPQLDSQMGPSLSEACA